MGRVPSGLMSPEKTKGSVLLISQVYVPDPAAVGTHFADVAEEMARRGWKVKVLTSARAYEDPSIRFPGRETRAGTDIRRFPLSSFGKRSIAVRLLAQAIFMTQALVSAIFTRELSVVVVSTSPPFAGFAGVILKMFTGTPFVWWVMDLNPDQLVAAGKLSESNYLVRLFEWMNRVTLRKASAVIALDQFMATRLEKKAAPAGELLIVPPWASASLKPSEGDSLAGFTDRQQAFREQHRIADKFVVMYSGNHALQHPLQTLLGAAALLEDNEGIVFVFIGGGAGKEQVNERVAAGAANILSLPYQPVDMLDASLGAADLQVVSMGDEVVGIVHPCKIYGAMAVGKPLLFFGPEESHAGEIVEDNKIGWRIDHGDVTAAATAICRARTMSPQDRIALGRKAAAVLASKFDRADLLKRVCEELEGVARHGAA